MGGPSIPSLTGGSAGPATSGLSQSGLSAGGSGTGNRGFINNFGQVNPPDVSTGLAWLPYLVSVSAVIGLVVLFRRK